MLVWTFILERTVVVYLASTYPKNDLQSRGALYGICAIYRRCSKSTRRRANDALVKRPLIRLRHLLPSKKPLGEKDSRLEVLPRTKGSRNSSYNLSNIVSTTRLAPL